ncbi:MAG: ABC transporter permease [Hyphomicrobiales bacterium]|nr:ABC transporter permease [Hyphomicrobiales bacterium]
MVLRRILIGLVLIWVVSVFIFVLTQVLPGDAAQIRLGQQATPESLAALRKELGLDRSLPVQYFSWIGNLLIGNLGISAAGGATIQSLIGNRIGNTVFMTAIVTLISVPLSVVLGLIAAMFPGRLIDRVITSSTLGLIAVPDFFVAIFLILFLAVQLRIVPAVSYLSGSEGFWKSVYVLALPIGTLVIVVSAQMIRMTRAGILNVMGSPYIEMAILKGVPRKRIILRHALFNAIGPIVNVIALNLAYLVSGVVVIETIFAYPGLAKLMVDGVQTRDIPLVQACGMIFCTTYVVLILIADIASIVSNPRLRHPK